MLLDDWPDYPMTCGAKFTFRGKIQRGAFETAVDEALARHPLLAAVIQPSWRHQWVWVAAQKRPPVHWIGSQQALDFAACRPYDLRAEPGARIWVQEQYQRTILFCEFHHACCDAAGGLMFIQDVLHLYAQKVNGPAHGADTLSAPNHLLLRHRGRFARKKLVLNDRLRRGWTDVASHIHLLTRTPQPVTSRASIGSPEPAPRRFVSMVFDRSFLTELRAKAAEYKATINDLMIRDLLLTLRDWNREHARGSRVGPLRIVVPMNLRTRIDLEMPSTNRLGYAFVTRNERQMTDDLEMLNGIRREMATVRRFRLPIEFVKKLNVLQTLRVGMPMVFRPDRCLATAVFSNLGDPSRRFLVRFPRAGANIVAGNLELMAFSGTTALRPLTRAGFFMNTYGNRLTICARVDPNHLTMDDATELLQRFATQFGGLPYTQQPPLAASA